MDWVFAPPVAFLIYMVAVGLLAQVGRLLAGETQSNASKTSTYGGGEPAPPLRAAPGYRQFFAVALFFAILHLGVLILATGDRSVALAIFLIGLMLTLLALIRGSGHRTANGHASARARETDK